MGVKEGSRRHRLARLPVPCQSFAKPAKERHTIRARHGSQWRDHLDDPSDDLISRASILMKPNTIIVTGSAGLIGSETVKHFAKEGQRIVGIDNDMRSRFFGAEASTRTTRDQLVDTVDNYEHHDIDIRDAAGLERQVGAFSGIVG